MKNGKQAPYKAGGIKFILSTCRTAFAWALRQRMLPPYTPNPFLTFGIDRLRSDEDENEPQIFTPGQEQQFFAACDEWQKPIFTILATYGLRVGELTHLLVEDVDFAVGAFHIRSKPEMFWKVKTRRQRSLPLTPQTTAVFRRLIGKRKAGFVFLHEHFASGTPAITFATDKLLLAHLSKITADLRDADSTVPEREQMKTVVAFCRQLGQIPERAVRSEFMALTERIGCPEFTRVHDLRHLFSSRAQEMGLNPLLVQDMLGHSTLEMTRRYTHLGLEAKREALAQVAARLEAKAE
jgi:integrase